MNKGMVFLVRLAMGLVGGWFLDLVFLTKLPVAQALTSGKDWFIVLVLAAFVVGAAYMSESLRKRK